MNNELIENVVVNDKTYKFVSKYKRNDFLRKEFNKLTTECFEFDLEDFYKQGYWDDTYTPYSIIDDNRIVANVSVADFDFTINQVTVKCVQIATVMTTKTYRKKGLCRFLIEKVILEWKDRSDLVYLFANGSVTKMYPRFGFYLEKEFVCSKQITKTTKKSNIIKLDMDNTNDRYFIIDMIKNSACIAEFASLNTLSMLIFYCTTSHKDHIYYLKDINAIIIVERKDRTIYLYDIFSRKHIEMEDVINSMNTDDTDRIVFGFTPIGKGKYAEEELKVENSTLFILDDKKGIFKNRKIRFPALTRT